MSKDGGSAFPKQPEHRYPDGTSIVMEQGGMSLRDYFAAAALQGILASPTENLQAIHSLTPPPHFTAYGLFVGYAYRIADAMIKARDS